MHVLVEFSIFPVDKGESLSPYVARAVTLIKKSGLTYHMGPMGTTIEGEWTAVMGLIDQCFKALGTDCNRILMNIKVDYRKGQTDDRIQNKIKSVEAKLGPV